MALIKCPHCGKPISDKAVKCPHCDNDIDKKIEVNGCTNGKKSHKKIIAILCVITLTIPLAPMMYNHFSNGNQVAVEEKTYSIPETKEDNFSPEPSNEINGHKYVELAGTKWATVNVGAVNGVATDARDEIYGYYYSPANAKRAAENWGGTWTLPTDAQWQKLIDECKWEWVSNYSFGGKTINGYIVSDKKDSSKFIFLPAVGIDILPGSSGFGEQNYSGGYCSSDNARHLYFDYDSYALYNDDDPFGMAVRPVARQSSSMTQTVQSSSTTQAEQSDKINGHEYVKLAGLKWATENVSTVPGVRAIAAHDVYGYYYLQDNAMRAAASWGGTWTLPSEAQWQKLIDECVWIWKEDFYFGGKTMNGYKVSDRHDSSKFIFLPAGGRYLDVDGIGLGLLSYCGNYWSSNNECSLLFLDCNLSIANFNPYNNGMSVRPVSE